MTQPVISVLMPAFNVEKYIAGFEAEVQQRLHAIRNILFEMIPETKEKISYQIL